MKLDVEEWSSGHGGRKMRGFSGPQMEMDCPFCGKPRHLYMALEKRIKGARTTYPGDFICMKCDERGRFIKLFAEIEGLDRREARMQLIEGIREPLPPPEKARFMTPKAMGLPAPAPVLVPAREETGAPRTGSVDERPTTPLPEEFIPCWDGEKWRIPKYLKERGLEKATLAAFNIGYCDHGEYADRIILPISCPEGVSFTSRAIDSEAFLRYKAGAGAGRLLFGWEPAMAMVEKGADTLVVNEGPFDVLSVYQSGVPSVGIMGKRFKAEQVAMIRSVKVKRIVMMLDADALRDAVKQAPELGSRAMIAASLGAKDANEAGTAKIRDAVSASRDVEGARPGLILGTLAKLKAKMNK